MQGKVIIVCGPIGSGKSTLSEELAHALGPDTLWLPEADERGARNPYLANYYDEPNRWAFTMQVHLLGLRFRQHLQAQWFTLNTDHHAVLDSSYWQDTAFARLQHRLKILNDQEFDTYAKLYTAMTASVLLPSIAIRILVAPTTCHARIQQRMVKQTGRQCEATISLDYLQKLDEEIGNVCYELQRMGTTVFDVPWDGDRSTAETRKQTVEGLTERLMTLAPADPFLAIHRRGL